jgi:hypothetical protein
MRSYSTGSQPHHSLKLDAGDPLRGDDVRALQTACARRLDARGIERPIKADGVYGPSSDKACRTAAHYLGALDTTLARRELPIGIQQMIRHPGRRNAAQLQRGEARMENLRKERAERPDPPHAGGGVSKLTDSQRSEARRIAVASFKLLYEHWGAVHYTQGPSRWEGINRRLRYADRRFPHNADCSSAYTWCLWNALTSVGGMDFRDVVNGSSWSTGYTGTMLSHGKPVSLSSLMPGDAILYGTGNGNHVVMYVGDGKCYSHGSEAGPFLLGYRYRNAVMGARRYI